jgi:hypothetical protein
MGAGENRERIGIGSTRDILLRHDAQAHQRLSHLSALRPLQPDRLALLVEQALARRQHARAVTDLRVDQAAHGARLVHGNDGGVEALRQGLGQRLCFLCAAVRRVGAGAEEVELGKAGWSAASLRLGNLPAPLTVSSKSALGK